MPFSYEEGHVTPRAIDAILIDTANGDRLATFYREVIGLPLQPERHDGTDRHWGCYIKGIHFAIHEKEQLRGVTPSVFSLSFEVDDVNEAVRELRAKSIPIALEPEDRSFGRLAAVIDPDGNLVYLHRYHQGPAPQ
jgi:predicted enzyme related to lactoylglutathione lyase